VEATVVRAVRPTSAKAGDRALVLPDGTIEGFVGGSCAESSVRLHSLRVLRAREPVMLRIVPEAPEREGAGAGAREGVGAGAREGVGAGEGAGARDDRTCAQDPGPGAGTGDGAAAEGLVTVANPCASGGMLEIFLAGVFPPPLVEVRGDAPIARALRTVGEALGYEIRTVGGPGELVAPDAAAVIVASHGRDEEPLLTAALLAGVPYVGLVASRRRGAQVVAALDVPSPDRDRLHTPAGLDIGARTPGEIALSIFAEIIAKRQQPSPAPPPPADAVVGSAPTETTDPVCGMTVAVTRATPQMTHDGRMWFFCGPGCRQAFADDPARYQG